MRQIVDENMDAKFLPESGNRVMIKRKLFEEYLDKATNCVREYQTITGCLIFQNGFKLGARMMLEVMRDN